MVACWPIGIERGPRDSREICLFEILGADIADEGGLVGVKAHHDDRLVDDVEKVRIAGDLTAFLEFPPADGSRDTAVLPHVFEVERVPRVGVKLSRAAPAARRGRG